MLRFWVRVLTKEGQSTSDIKECQYHQPYLPFLGAIVLTAGSILLEFFYKSLLAFLAFWLEGFNYRLISYYSDKH